MIPPEELARLAAFYDRFAKPLDGKFTRADLYELLHKISHPAYRSDRLTA
jgi:hypothetical protein